MTREKTPFETGFTRSILESISDGVFTVDQDWRVTSFNKAAEHITGVPREEAIGRMCWDVFRANMCESGCALRQTMETGQAVVNRPAFIVNARGLRVPISVSTGLLLDEEGNTRGGVETFRDLTLVEQLRKELTGHFEAGDMVCQSSAMRKVMDLVPALSQSDSHVLVRGETGTGKELLARAIHFSGPRKKEPFVAVNCSALPDNLLESELFGYKAGAFTGANKDKPGRLALAGSGTLFLDEVGDMSPALQVKLLRVLEDGNYEPLGATKTQRSSARFLFATNRDLGLMVAEGTFRQDLFYRVNVVEASLPPLRERKTDIPLLVEHFTARFNQLQKKSVTGVDPEVLDILMAHDYPGNVRELENIMEHTFVLCGRGNISLRHLPSHLIPPAALPPRAGKLTDMVRAFEVRAITDALERHGNNRLAAARELGLHKSTLFRKLKALNIPLPDTDGRHKNG